MDYIQAAAGCTRDEEPVCAVACPFHLDIRTLITRIRGGRFDSVYRLLRDAMVFPEVALTLCTAPCAAVCERHGLDAAVNLRGLELAAVRRAGKKEALRLNVPPKPQRIAIIGAGISGLGCALRFSMRGYPVTVYEKSDRLGGSLWGRFPDGAFLEEIELQFKNTNCEFRLSAEVGHPGDIEADAIYVATGRGGADFGRAGRGLFFGGGVCGQEGVFALGEGIDAVNRMEAFLKTGIMAPPAERPKRPANKPDPALLAYTPPVAPAGDYYTGEEAALEALRCLQCNCGACARRCPLVRHYQRFPDRIAEDVEGTVRPTDIIHNRLATRLVASCDQCGLCAEDCPQGVDLCGMLAGAKQEMKSKGEMPGNFSAFWLEDMAHAEEYALFAMPGQTGRCGYLFFPGCQLGAADPRYVSGAYQRLKERYPDTALLADCCGAPAFWAGDMQLFNEKTVKLRAKWEALGSPVLVYACPSCAMMLRKALPGCEPVPLYSLDLGWAEGGGIERGTPGAGNDGCPAGSSPAKSSLAGDGAAESGVIGDAEAESSVAGDAAAESGVIEDTAAESGVAGIHSRGLVSVFDPCASRFDKQAQEGVRGLLAQSGFRLLPLAYERENTLCCGWGGQSMLANPGIAGETAARCAAMTDTTYVTYCVNCRDSLAGAGKPALHILDVLLGINDIGRKTPTHTQRRQNRERLLREMAGAAPGYGEEDLPRIVGAALYLDDALREKLSRDWLLEEDVLEAVLYCESQNRKIYNTAAGSFAGHFRLGRLTYWVEYKPEGAGYRLLNAYAHKLEIDEA